MTKKRKLYEAIQEQRGQYMKVAYDEGLECTISTTDSDKEYIRYIAMVDTFNRLYGANAFHHYTRRLKKWWGVVDKIANILKGIKYYPMEL